MKPENANQKADFAGRLKRERRRLGLTQQELADMARISVRTYRDWEEGRTLPPMGPRLRAIAEVIRIEPGVLLDGE